MIQHYVTCKKCSKPVKLSAERFDEINSASIEIICSKCVDKKEVK